MAADWIKWEKGFASKPEVATTAELLGLTLEAAAVLWMRYFEWVDDQTVNGWVPNITPARLDLIMGHKGFSAAACHPEVRWITFQDGGLIQRNFERHNGKSAKKRALHAERTRAARRKQTE